MKRLQPFIFVLVLLTIAVLPEAYCQTDSTWVKSAWTQSEGTWEEGVAPDTSGNIIIASVDTTENLAFEKLVTDITGATTTFLTDASTSSIWKSGQVDCLHFYVVVDLGVNRLVDSVRVLPKPRNEHKFPKGYSIKLSTDNIVWTVAVIDLNLATTEIDTSFTPQLARYVKIEIENIDKINEVIIAEIEVYGRGFMEQGTYTSASEDFDEAVGKNFGIASWEADVPEGTDLSIQFRTGDSSTPGGAWSEWSPEYEYQDATGVLFLCYEPRRYLQYKVNLSSINPKISPRLESLSIKYSTDLLAASSSASIKVLGDSVNAAPDTVTVGRLTDFVYTVDFEFDDESKGFHEIFISTPNQAEVTNCYFVSQGSIQIPVAGYTWSSTNEGITLELPDTLRADTTLAVDFRIKLYDEQNDFPGMILNRTSSPENPQFVDQQTTDAWRVVITGHSEKVLIDVKATPSPFSPNGDGVCDWTRFEHTIAKIAIPREVTVSVFNLNGKLVWEHKEMLSTGDYKPQWDGKDNDGELVNPGLYIFRIKVDADETSISTGTIVVAY